MAANVGRSSSSGRAVGATHRSRSAPRRLPCAGQPEPAQRVAHRLPALGERAIDHAPQRSGSHLDRRGRQPVEPHDHRVHRRPRPEHRGRHPPGDDRLGVVGDPDAHRAVVLVARRPAASRSPTSRCTITSSRCDRGRGRQDLHHHRHGDVVRKVGAQGPRDRLAERRRASRASSRRRGGSGRSRPCRRPRCSAGIKRAVELDREHLGPGRRQRHRERAQAGADLHDPIARADAGLGRRSRGRGSGRSGSSDPGTWWDGCRGGGRARTAPAPNEPGSEVGPSPGSPAELDVDDAGAERAEDGEGLRREVDDLARARTVLGHR